MNKPVAQCSDPQVVARVYICANLRCAECDSLALASDEHDLGPATIMLMRRHLARCRVYRTQRIAPTLG